MSGYLNNGQWHDGWYDTQATHGEFVRTASGFRGWVTADGAGASTVNIDHIKRHYYMSHPHINPSRIVPVGPRLHFLAPVGQNGDSRH